MTKCFNSPNRRQKDGRIFPVAVYTCNEDYELENEDNDRLYCSKREWIGTHPNCMQLEEAYDENGEDGEGEDEGNLRFGWMYAVSYSKYYFISEYISVESFLT